ncbi:MAG TPA: glycosyltransferase family 2 protein [bacterium]|nr:glycosyltransferase family 2 protein [bacterium]
MAAPRPLSVAIVCMDEEDRIGQCLSSVKFADEIVVVDSGSRDRTLEIAGRFTSVIHHREWKGWRDQKAWAAKRCKNEWVLTLDADEAVSGELQKEILELLARDEVRENGFTVPRRTHYLGRWVRHSGWYPDRKLRLYKKELAVFGGDDPHEVIEVPGPVGELHGDLIHYTYRDFRHHAAQITRYALVNAEARHQRGARAGVAALALRPPFAFLKLYVLKRGFLDGVPGLLIGVMNGWYYTFVKYARLWELSRGGR